MKAHTLIIIFSFLVDILNDPRFLNCINEMDIVNHPAKLMPAYARCASVIGRPRYIKFGYSEKATKFEKNLPSKT